ncbi:unnamed protein product [Acanthoscelides obtectus]|uniref:Uncharacterized protein n=2 Tax=Acanthoscelides obtectus TaxID=200917 RepID=A0A9P0M6C4_ACAOB|nr:unnamed protein product [Acanthoscelides obtectus]
MINFYTVSSQTTQVWSRRVCRCSEKYNKN